MTTVVQGVPAREPVWAEEDLVRDGFVREPVRGYAARLRSLGVEVRIGPDWASNPSRTISWLSRWAALLLNVGRADLVPRFLASSDDRAALLVVLDAHVWSTDAYMRSL